MRASSPGKNFDNQKILYQFFVSAALRKFELDVLNSGLQLRNILHLRPPSEKALFASDSNAKSIYEHRKSSLMVVPLVRDLPGDVTQESVTLYQRQSVRKHLCRLNTSNIPGEKTMTYKENSFQGYYFK